jgi:apolipoprotein N-acyltransferase
LGYLWLETPIAQVASLLGSYGLSLLTLVIAVLLAAVFLEAKGAFVSLSGRLLAVVLAAALLLVAWAWGLNQLKRTPPMPDKQALLVQGNTDPLGRAQGGSDDIAIYKRVTSEAIARLESKPELVIWPEGGVIGIVGALEHADLEDLRFELQTSVGEAALITGMSVWERAAEGYLLSNSVYGLAEARVTDRYDKVYLVPFGESLPFSQALASVYRLVYGWFQLSSEYARLSGKEIKPISTPPVEAGVYICYESVFPQVARQMVKKGAEVLVNISNDAWFGLGNGAEQHYAMGTMRAIETGRYVLRAGIDGITAVIDPQGKTLERIPRFEEATLLADYALESSLTPYVRFGDWLVYAVMVYGLFASLVLLGRRSSF